MAGLVPCDQGRSERPAAGLGKGLREVRERGPRSTSLPRAVQFLSGGRQRYNRDARLYPGRNGRLYVRTGDFCAFFQPGVVH